MQPKARSSSSGDNDQLPARVVREERISRTGSVLFLASPKPISSSPGAAEARVSGLLRLAGALHVSCTRRALLLTPSCAPAFAVALLAGREANIGAQTNRLAH